MYLLFAVFKVKYWFINFICCSYNVFRLVVKISFYDPLPCVQPTLIRGSAASWTILLHFWRSSLLQCQPIPCFHVIQPSCPLVRDMVYPRQFPFFKQSHGFSLGQHLKRYIHPYIYHSPALDCGLQFSIRFRRWQKLRFTNRSWAGLSCWSVVRRPAILQATSTGASVDGASISWKRSTTTTESCLVTTVRTSSSTAPQSFIANQVRQEVRTRVVPNNILFGHTSKPWTYYLEVKRSKVKIARSCGWCGPVLTHK